MQMMTSDIEAAFEATSSTDGTKYVPIIVKYFSPLSNWSWYATEGEKIGPGPNDWRLFGLVKGHETELGFFDLEELATVTSSVGGIERDLHFQGFLDMDTWPVKTIEVRGEGSLSAIQRLCLRLNLDHRDQEKSNAERS